MLRERRVPEPMFHEQRPSIVTLLSGAPEFALGAVLLTTWIDPSYFGNEWIARGLMLMLLEFFLIHANAFLTLRALQAPSAFERVLRVLGFGTLYALCGIFLSLAFKDAGPALAIIGLTVTRTFGAMGSPPPTQAARNWFGFQVATNVLLYVGLAAATILSLPELGVPSGSYSYQTDDPGEWEKHPHKVVAMGSVFYMVRGLIVMAAWLRKIRLDQIQVT